MGRGYRHRKTDLSSGGLHSETYPKKEQKQTLRMDLVECLQHWWGALKEDCGGQGREEGEWGITGAAEHLGIN